MNKSILTILFAIFVVAFTISTPAQSWKQEYQADVKVEAQSFGKSNDDENGASALGSWKMIVSSDTFPVPFRTLITFDSGGGVIGSAQGDILLSPPPGVAPSATAAHGAWKRNGNKKILFTIHQIFYTADGQYAGSAKIQNAGTLTGNNMSGTFVVRYYDENDQQVFVGQGSFSANRIAVETPVP